MNTPYTPQDCVETVGRTYRSYRNKGVPADSAIGLTAERLNVTRTIVERALEVENVKQFGEASV